MKLAAILVGTIIAIFPMGESRPLQYSWFRSTARGSEGVKYWIYPSSNVDLIRFSNSIIKTNSQ